MAGPKSDVSTATAKVTRVGNSLGLILSKDVLAKLNVGLGDSLFLVERPDGYHLTPYDPEFEQQMAVAKAIMKKDRDILRELAK
jgi:putative addiction module antidote